MTETSQPRDLRIRVHSGHSNTFVVHIYRGVVDAVTAEEYRSLLGLSELDCRDTLRALQMHAIDLDALEARAAQGWSPYLRALPPRDTTATPAKPAPRRRR